MHSRRDAGFVEQYPRSKTRLHQRKETDRASYDTAMRREEPLLSHGSVSPRGLSRDVRVSQRIFPTEQRDYDRHLSGSRSDRVGSRSPLAWPRGDVRKRHRISEEVEVSHHSLSSPQHFELQQRAELTGPVDLNVNNDLHTEQAYDEKNNLRNGKERAYYDARFPQRPYDYEHDCPRLGKEKVYNESRFPQGAYDHEHNYPRIGKENVESRFPQLSYDHEHNDPRSGKDNIYDDSKISQHANDHEHNDPRIGKDKVYDESIFPQGAYDHEHNYPRIGKEVYDESRFPQRAYDHENNDPRIRKEKVYDDARFQQHAYDYEHNDSRIGKEKVHGDSRFLQHDSRYEHNDSRIGKEKVCDDATFQQMGLLAQKFFVDDAAARGSYRLPPAPLVLSNYGEADGLIPSSSQNEDALYNEHERLRCADPVVPDRLEVAKSYTNEEKPMSNLRDVSYPLSSSHSKEFERSSLEKLRGDFVVSYQDGMCLPPNEFSGGRGKLVESTGFGAYREWPVTDSVRNMETGRRDPTYYHRGAYGPPKGEHQDYQHPESQTIVNDLGYPSDGLKKTVSQMQIEYDHPGAVHDHRDISRCGIVHPVIDRNDNSNSFCGHPRKCMSWDRTTFKNQAGKDYLDMTRTSSALKKGGNYLDSRCAHVECGRRVSQEYEISHLGLSKDHQISGSSSYYAIDRDAGRKHQEGRFLNPPKFKNDFEVHTHDVRTKRIRDELGTSKQPDKFLKRKFVFEEDNGIHNSRTTASNKWYASRGLHEMDGKWSNEDMNDLYMPKERVLDCSEYINNKITYYEEDRLEDFVSDDWLSSQEAKLQKHNAEFHKHGSRNVKGRRRPGSLSWCNSHHLDRRSGIYRQHKVWKRNDDYYENMHPDDGNKDTDPSEDWGNRGEPDPSEDFEEIKQLVHEAFLKYTKKLNINPAVSRRYKNQGESGSLFCIVCGRSVSKEFMDTQRLVTHAFMSHKRGRRAEHLGLHKAICVLLGWSTVVPADTVTWVPDILPKAEALAQKEDLIIWPPVTIIHNISMSDSNPKNWKVVTIEALEAFLRGKGLIKGRIKVYVGKPSDQSIFVVKFLGTFTGLGDAEKIHEYFSQFKHGRVEFERATSNNGKIIVNQEAGNRVEKLEEHLLYGYMGIAEDMDKVDFTTRKTCSIKSKKDIQDLANAPVKPDGR